MMTYKFKPGDNVQVCPDWRTEKVYSEEVYTISGVAEPTSHRWYYLKGYQNKYTVDGSFREEALRLALNDYDPTQMGDQEDDI